LYKNNFYQLHKLSFIFLPENFQVLENFPYFFFFFFSFSSFSSSSLFPPLLLPHDQFFSHIQNIVMNEQRSSHRAPPQQPSLWHPSCTLAAPPSPSSPSPSFPSPVSSPMGSHGSSNSGHGRLPWRASHKLIFLHGMTKMDAHDLPLAIPALNFIRNKLKSPDFARFCFSIKLIFYL
jgi:hypothetical protein